MTYCSIDAHHLLIENSSSSWAKSCLLFNNNSYFLSTSAQYSNRASRSSRSLLHKASPTLKSSARSIRPSVIKGRFRTLARRRDIYWALGRARSQKKHVNNSVLPRLCCLKSVSLPSLLRSMKTFFTIPEKSLEITEGCERLNANGTDARTEAP